MTGKKISENSVRWGMIGTGDVTEKKSGPAFSLIESSELIAVTNRTLGKAEDYARRHNIPNVYSSTGELLSDPRINAIYIATPPGSHLALAKQVAEAGKPCYIEKPMARTSAECDAMNEAFESRSLPLYVAYYRRCLPNFLKVKSLLEDNTIGDIRSIAVELIQPGETEMIAKTNQNWRVDPATSGGGYFYDLGSHQFDIFEFLLGPIADLNGYKTNQGSSYSAADIVTTSFRFESGVLGSGIWSFNGNQKSAIEEVVIQGSQGSIRFPCFADGRVTLERGEDIEEWNLELPEHIQQPLIQSIVDDLLGIGHCPSTGRSASRANHWLEQVIQF